MIDCNILNSYINSDVTINSIDLFSITYDNNLENFISYATKYFPNVKIRIYFNLEKYFKDFIYTNNIFNKIIHLKNKKNICLKSTQYDNQILVINKNSVHIYNCNNINKNILVNSDIFTDENFNIKLLAKLYKIYVTSKENLYDSEFECFYKKNNNINLKAAIIPQFSSFKHAHTTSTEIIYNKNKPLSYIELGSFLNPNGEHNNVAQKKYGENHGKFSNLLDFCYINNGKTKSFSPTILGEIYVSLSESDKEKLLKFQLYKLYIVQKILINNISNKNEVLELMSSVLSISTAKRRLSNINTIIQFLKLH